MNDFYVIRLLEKVNIPINKQTYEKGTRVIVWELEEYYAIANCDMELIPKTSAKKVYKIIFEKMEGGGE
jgi:hypothetical protein